MQVAKTQTYTVMHLFPLFVALMITITNVTDRQTDRHRAGAVVAPPLWGEGSPKGAESSKNLIFDGHMYKYAVFDIKPTYNH